MERWAKSINAQKAAQQHLLQQLIHQEKAVQETIISDLENPSFRLREEPLSTGISLTAAIEVTGTMIVTSSLNVHVHHYLRLTSVCS